MNPFKLHEVLCTKSNSHYYNILKCGTHYAEHAVHAFSYLNSKYLVTTFNLPRLRNNKPTSLISQYLTFSSPTDARVEFIKTRLKIRKAAATCFGLQGNHHQGASQRLAKITHLVHVGT